MVTERQQNILNLIIDIFTKTHEPVGSKSLQESINSSSATIRNDMATLEKQGLLEKAHTSSGRMPSVAGFQYYVKHSLSFDRLAENQVYEIVKAFDQEFFKLEDILQEATKILSDLSGCTVVALDVEPSRQKLTAFDIVVLGQHTALAVFTLDESRTVTSQFLIPRNFLQEDLNRLKNVSWIRLFWIFTTRFGQRFRKLSNVTSQQQITSWILLSISSKKCSMKISWFLAKSIF